MKNAFCKVQIDFDALLYNYRQIKNLHSELMPVIKADAYAHGAIKIARFFENQDVKYFATGTIHEALELRKNGVTKEIIPLLGALTDEEYKQGNEQDIVSLAHDKQSLEKALAYSEKIAVKINSGMGRLGFLPQDIDTVIMKLKKHNKTASYALTHYASADIISAICRHRQKN
jgi:alanine racemase